MQSQNLKPVRSYTPSRIASLSVAQWFKQQRKPKITFLPYEILLVIFQPLDDQSLARMVQSCHFFRNLIEPILYRHIRVFRTHEEEMSNPFKSHLLYRTLAGRPDLLPIILSYHGPLIPDLDAFKRIAYREDVWKRSLWLRMSTPSPRRIEALTFHECLEIAQFIFSKTLNIQDLHFTDGIKHCMLQVLGSFSAPESKMMKIQRLAFTIHGYSPTVMSILQTQPTLKHLELHQGGANMPFEETDVPELESLKAHLWDAMKIVPGRPVKKLELLYDWNFEPSHVEGHFRRLALSTCGITDFTVQSGHSWSDDVALKHLRLLCRHLPKIERLCFRLCCEVSDSVFLEILPAFSSLSYLKLLGVVSKKEKFDEGQWHNTIAQYSPEDFGDFVQSLKERCCNLTEVEWCRTATYSCCSWEGEVVFRYREPQ